MKALPWRRWISLAVGILGLAATLQPLRATEASPAPTIEGTVPGLPEGLPELPVFGETMQRHLRSGLALRGYDPVAYRLRGEATPGLPDYEWLHKGVVWRFASAGNRDAFRDAPEVYEPAFAGFDAKGVAEGRAVETDPRQFAIIGTRLFLFHSAENRARFVADSGLMALAGEHWAAVYQTVAD